MIDRISNNTNLLERSLDAAWLRNDVISNNIANVNTPGFKKSSVKFEEFLSNAGGEFQISSAKKNPKFLPIGSDSRIGNPPVPQVVQDSFTSSRKDGNNVDIDVEMAELAKNSIRYDTLAAQLNKEFSILKLAINEGRK